MAREHHVPLFHPRLVRERAAHLDPALFQKHEKAIGVWLEHLRSGALDATKEVSLHGGFLERIFGDVLGYKTMALAEGGAWELEAEKSVLLGGSADGAIGFFSKGKSRVLAPIELKGATQFLEHAKGRSLTPIQQGWDYANKAAESRWIIVSNYRETRLYAKSRGQAAYELFWLEDLANEAGFRRWCALLGRDALLGDTKPEESPLALMLLSSERTEREVTAKLYEEYRGMRARLFSELRKSHPDRSPDDLIAHAQTTLDRVLFIAFAEDRGLLPPNTLAKASESVDPYNPQPRWKNFLAVFRSVDKGNKLLGIPAYNGGLFRETDELERLTVSDEMCLAFKELGVYDFGDDVSVDVLGHIFEQSITDLEQLRREALPPAYGGGQVAPSSTGTQKKPSKRKREGIFYTPPFVTSFLVRETLGCAFADAWDRASAGRATNKKDRIAGWEAYQNELRKIRVLDPACGSGAFLVAAFDALAHEFDRANRGLAELRGQQASLFDLTRTVLNENLFGLDRSGESVEISKLSLWLKTAERGKQLTFLDSNIRHGNSVVSDPMIDPLAFDWGAGKTARALVELSPQLVEEARAIDLRWRDGFDVVLGNPPYVRHELLSAYKDHWKTTFEAFDGTADLFVYFFERGLAQLKPGGRLGYIVSNKWLRGGYAEKLRSHFAKQCTIETIVDFGHAPVFPDADAFPCIITLRKTEPTPEHTVSVTLYPREELGKELLASYVETHRFELPQTELAPAGWVLERPAEQLLLTKLRKNGTPLGEFAGHEPSCGIKTGYNEAFLIDNKTKEEICKDDPGSAVLMAKYLRGQDIARWNPDWAGLWIILLKSSGDHEWPWSKLKNVAEAERAFEKAFPGAHKHLKQFEERLIARADQGRYWWELRSCAYYEEFSRSKLVYQEIQFHSAYALDRSGVFTNNKAFFIPTEDPWLVAVLNSPAMWWHNWRHLVHVKDEALSAAGEKMLQVPIPKPTDAQRKAASAAVASIMEHSRAVSEIRNAVLDLLRVQYDVEAVGQALEDFAALGSDEFVREVKKRRPKKGPALTATGLKELRTLYEVNAPKIEASRAQIVAGERTLADLVHSAFKLDTADLELLRSSAPPRMPQNW